jgi:maleate cis-trans isomerase
VESGGADNGVDGVFISCTNFQGVAAAPLLADALGGVPCISSNGCVTEAVVRWLG